MMNSAHQQTVVLSGTPAVAVNELSLPEMLRVMDVAREMRKDRESAEQVLRRDEVRAHLRQKLLRTAQLSGDRVTEAEIDAAIDIYFADRHRYNDPAMNGQVFLAHLWVRRQMLFAGIVVSLVFLMTLWGLFLAPFAPLSPSVRAARAATAVKSDAAQVFAQIEAIAQEPAAIELAQRLLREISSIAEANPTGAIAAQRQLADLYQQLSTQFTLKIARDPVDGANIILRAPVDRESAEAYYVLVEAIGPDGKTIPQQILNAETGKSEFVSIWAEQVPTVIGKHLEADKLADGILSVTEFGKKERGKLEVEATILDTDGLPIKRSVQITDWNF